MLVTNSAAAGEAARLSTTSGYSVFAHSEESTTGRSRSTCDNYDHGSTIIIDYLATSSLKVNFA